MAHVRREWGMSCEQCIRQSQINLSFTCPSMKNPTEFTTAREDAMQFKLVPELSPSVGFDIIETAMDLFSRYFYAYPTSNQDAKAIALVSITILTKHSYLPTTRSSDKGSAFMSHVIKKVAGVLEKTLRHATTKHAQTICMLERSDASIKQALKIETGERRSLWQKYVSIAVLY